MKNKWKKIFALLAAIVALLSLFIVPTFADATEYVAPNLGTTWEYYYNTLYPQAQTPATEAVWSYMLGYGDLRFFDYNLMVASSMISSSATLGQRIIADDYFNIKSQVDFDYGVIITSDGVTYAGAGYIYYEYEYLTVTTGQARVVISLGQDQITFYYSITNDSTGGTAVLNGTYSNEYQMCFLINNYSNLDYLDLVCNLLFDFQAYSPTQTFYNPKQFYNGSINQYTDGYDEGWRYGFDAGFDDAVNSGAAFEAGYNEALRQVNSEEFGRNFLGNILRAPIDALNSFTLVSWSLADGTVIEFTLGSLFGAVLGAMVFIWFIKMFAGG